LLRVPRVHRCWRGRRIISLPRLTISRICALWLITLILLPFTAPFKSYDLANSTSDRSHDGLPKDKTDSEQKVAGPSDWFLFPPARNTIVVKHFARLSLIEEHPLQSTILRL
jgi:hypothetical protein